MSVIDKDFIRDAFNTLFNSVDKSRLVLDVPYPDSAGLSLTPVDKKTCEKVSLILWEFPCLPEEVKDNQLLIVPVDLEVIVDAQLGKVTHSLLNLVQVQIGGQLNHGHICVGKNSPALEVTVDYVFPHLKAAEVDLPPVVVVFGWGNSHRLARPPRLTHVLLDLLIAVETLIVGQLLLLTNVLPKGAAMAQHVVEIVTRSVETYQRRSIKILGQVEDYVDS